MHDAKRCKNGDYVQGCRLKVCFRYSENYSNFRKGKNGGEKKEAATTHRVALDLRRAFIGSTQRWKTEGSGVSAFISRGQWDAVFLFSFFFPFFLFSVSRGQIKGRRRVTERSATFPQTSSSHKCPVKVPNRYSFRCLKSSLNVLHRPLPRCTVSWLGIQGTTFVV